MEPGRAIRRKGTRAGDEVWVSGTIGDGALGLRVLQGALPADPGGHLADRYRLPLPRIALGRAAAPHVVAGMDVSDGLAQDLGHLCRAAGCGAEIAIAEVPLSPAARAAVEADPSLLPAILTGGDDYELLLAVRPGQGPALEAAASACGMSVTRIGRFADGPPEVILRRNDNTAMPLAALGWSHFR